MAFKKGQKRVDGAGIKKGQKQARTQLREQLEAKGIYLADELAKLLQDASTFQERAEAIKIALPYCLKKMPQDHSVSADVTHRIDYANILAANGIKPRE